MKKLSILLLSVTTLLLSVTSVSAVAETYHLKQKISPTISNTIFTVASGDAPTGTFVSGEPITLLGTHGLTAASYTQVRPYPNQSQPASAFDGYGTYASGGGYKLFDSATTPMPETYATFMGSSGSLNIKLTESTSVNAVYIDSSWDNDGSLKLLPKDANISYSVDGGVTYIEHQSIVIPYAMTSVIPIADTPNVMTDLKIVFLNAWVNGNIHLDELHFLAK
jgi:hypothetical protein